MARPDPGPDMKHLAEQFVASMRGLGWELDFSEQSVQTLEVMVEQQFADWRPWRSGKVAAAIQLLSGTWTSPPAKAQKRFVNGQEDNLAVYYEALKTQA